MANTQKTSKKATTEQCNKHIVSGSDSKECKTCKHYDSVKIGCNHPHWDKCIKRDADKFVIDYVYHEYHYR